MMNQATAASIRQPPTDVTDLIFADIDEKNTNS